MTSLQTLKWECANPSSRDINYCETRVAERWGSLAETRAALELALSRSDPRQYSSLDFSSDAIDASYHFIHRFRQNRGKIADLSPQAVEGSDMAEQELRLTQSMLSTEKLQSDIDHLITRQPELSKEDLETCIIPMGNPITGYKAVTALRLPNDQVLTTDPPYKFHWERDQRHRPWPSRPDAPVVLCNQAAMLLTHPSYQTDRMRPEWPQFFSMTLTSKWMSLQ